MCSGAVGFRGHWHCSFCYFDPSTNRTFASVKCTDLTTFTGEQSCASSRRPSEKTTCDAITGVNMALQFFRSQDHYTSIFNNLGQANMAKWFRTPGPIFSSVAKDYTNCAMNSASESECAENWKVGSTNSL